MAAIFAFTKANSEQEDQAPGCINTEPWTPQPDTWVAVGVEVTVSVLVTVGGLVDVKVRVDVRVAVGVLVVVRVIVGVPVWVEVKVSVSAGGVWVGVVEEVKTSVEVNDGDSVGVDE